jgi:hypothetical protein
MALYPAYRLTIMKPQRVDPTESTPLTPVAGAIHSDNFKVATVSGLTGYQPYLFLPQGRKGRIDPVSGKLDIGTMNFRLLDDRPGTTSNLQRWVTAFIGDSNGKAVLRGCRAVVEESLDWNATTASGSWSPFVAGRITDVALDDVLTYSITVSEPTQELSVPCFVGRPYGSATGVVLMGKLPKTFTGNYGPFQPDVTFTGVVSTSPDWRASRRLTFDAASQASPYNRIELMSGIWQAGGTYTLDTPYDNYVLRLSSGSTVAEYRIPVEPQGVLANGGGSDFSTLYTKVTAVDYIGMDVNAYFGTGSAVGLFPLGTSVTASIVPKSAISKTDPILISDVHPARLMKDLVQGYYGYMNSGSVPFPTMTVDDTAFTNLIADPTFPNVRFVIEKKAKVSDFIESQLAPCGLGYRIESRNISGSIVPVFVPFDNRLPQTLGGLPTITDADVADYTSITWKVGDPLVAITLTSYLETYTPPSPNTTSQAADDSERFKSEPMTATTLIPEALNANGTTLDVDLQGNRFIANATGTGSFEDANLKMDTARTSIFKHLESRFANGAHVASFKCRRTSTVTGLKLGNWTLVDVDALPDPQTNLRGGARLMQVIEYSEDGPNISLRLIDAGVNVSTTPPFNPSLTTNNSALYLTVSALQNQRVNIQTAPVSIGLSRPADSSSLWLTQIPYTAPYSGSNIYYIGDMRWGYTYHVRVRTESATGQQPSAWVSANSASYALPAGPANLSVAVSASRATLTWTNPATSGSGILVQMASPSSSAPQNVILLPASSTAFVSDPLSTGSADNPYRFLLYYTDDIGTLTSGSVINFYNTTSMPKCPNVSAFYAVSTTPY